MTDRALADALTRHQIYLQRYASGRVNAALPFIRRMARELRARVAEDDLTTFQAMRLTALQRDLERIAAGALAAVEQQLTLDLEGLAEYEAQWANRILAGAVVVDTAAVAPELVRAAIATVPMKLLSGDEVREVTIQQAFREFAGSIAQDVRQTVQAGIVTGETTPNIARQVSSLVDNRTRRQAETLVRTVTNHAGNTARMEVWKRNADIITHEKFAATLDNRVTLQCAANDGKVSPLGTGPRPPLHWACLAPGAKVSTRGGVAYISKRPFNGQIITLRTSSDNLIAVTGNHPIMTDRGFVAAELIEEGDNLVCADWADSSAPAGDYDQVIPTIEECFDSVLRSGQMVPCPVPTTAEDFHGDVSENEVCVVLIDRGLPEPVVSAITHKFVEGFLQRGGFNCTVAKSRGRHFTDFVVGLFSEFGCRMGVAGEVCDLLRRRIVHSGLLLLGSVADVDAELPQQPGDDVCGNPEFPGDPHAPYPAAVGSEDGVCVEGVADVHAGCADPAFCRRSVEDREADASYAADFRDALSLPHHFDRVVEVRRVDLSGHVYNLQCRDGFYSANGIVTHNCRSVLIPQVRPDLRIAGLDSKRSSIDGPVDASLTYDGFLRRQDEAFQNDVLGPERAKLFRAGMPVSRFTDASGRTYTLAELRAIDNG